METYIVILLLVILILAVSLFFTIDESDKKTIEIENKERDISCKDLEIKDLRAKVELYRGISKL